MPSVDLIEIAVFQMPLELRDIGEYPGIIHRATDWRRDQAIEQDFVTNWNWMRRRGFGYRGCYQRLRADQDPIVQAEALLRVLEAVGGQWEGEWAELDAETTPDSYPSVAQCVAWYERLEAEGLRVSGYFGMLSPYAEEPEMLARPWRLPWWNLATYPGPGEWWGHQWSCAGGAPGLTGDVCKNEIERFDVLDRLAGYGGHMAPPYPLDYQPPYIAARWQRSTHRSYAGLHYPQMGVLHTTEGGKGTTRAEAGANYNATRTTQVSCQVFIDDDSVVQSVYDENVSFSAGPPWNDIGVHAELCANAGTSPITTFEDWFAVPKMLELIAWYIAKMYVVYGIPIEFYYSPDMQANGFPHGWTTHHEITDAEQNPGAIRDWFAANGMTPSNTHRDPAHTFYPDEDAGGRDAFDDYPIGEVFRLARAYVGAPEPGQGKDDDVPVLLVNSQPYPQFKAAADLGYVPPDGANWPVGWVWFERMPGGGKKWLYGEDWQAAYDFCIANSIAGLQRTTGKLQSIPDYTPPMATATVDLGPVNARLDQVRAEVEQLTAEMETLMVAVAVKRRGTYQET